MAATRTAHAVWEGGLLDGKGSVSAGSSSLFSALPVSWASRTEAVDGRTSPEELLAAAHASCYCMALSFGLANAGTPPAKLEASATVTFAPAPAGGFHVQSSHLVVKGTVPGMTAEAFQAAAEGAKDGCPISKAMAGNVALSVEASLA